MILDKIVEHKKVEVSNSKSNMPLEQLKKNLSQKARISFKESIV